MSSEAVIKADGLGKTYRIYAHPLQGLVSRLTGDRIGRHRSFDALRDVSFEIGHGETVGVIGRNGSGKSTLLQLICGIRKPSAGSVSARGKVSALLELGSGFHPELTGRENVAIPLRADRLPRGEIASRVERALSAVGIAHRADHYPSEMSGGEMQRIAIARALATDARVILADEPTGNLDSVHGEEILELLKHASEHAGRAVILVTHDLRSAAYGDRHIVLRDGRIVDVVTPGQPNAIGGTSTRH